MKEPLKEVPVELIKRLNWMEGHMTDTCRPYAEALRDLIEDWKRLKEASMDDDDYAVLYERDTLYNKLERVQHVLEAHKAHYLEDKDVFSVPVLFENIQDILNE